MKFETIRNNAFGDLLMVTVVGAMTTFGMATGYSISSGLGSTDPIPNPVYNVILPAIAVTALVWIAVTANRVWGSEE